MHSVPFAVIMATATAAIAAVLTEPNSKNQSGEPEAAVSVIVKTAAKGDRLDLRSAPTCSATRATPNSESDSDFRHQEPLRRLSRDRIVLVSASE
jgi:hypothetical protein